MTQPALLWAQGVSVCSTMACVTSHVHFGGSCALKNMLEHRDIPAFPGLLNIGDGGWRRERPIYNLKTLPSAKKTWLLLLQTRDRRVMVWPGSDEELGRVLGE